MKFSHLLLFACLVSSRTTLAQTGAIIWSGNGTTNAWSNTGNWSGGRVPTAAQSVVIPAVAVGKYYPTVPAGQSPACFSLTVSAGATLTISGTLTVNSTLTDAGTIVIASSSTSAAKQLTTRNNVTINTTGTLTNNGKLIFTGTNNTSASTPLVFTNDGTITSGNDALLQFSNTRPVTLNGGGTTALSNISFTAFGNAPLTIATTNYLDVSRVATLNASDVYSQGKLRLISNATTTGILFNAGSGIVPDTIETQRYITYSKPADASAPNQAGFGYRQYSSPVEGANFSMFKRGTSFVPVYDNPAKPYQYPANGNPQPFPLIFLYDQNQLDRATTTGPEAFNYGWIAINEGTMLEAARGYTVQISALNTTTGNPNTVSVRGVPHTGDYDSPVYVRGSNPQSGLQMVGNPYPGFISMFDVTADNIANGFDQVVFKIRSVGPYAGSYETYDPGDGSNVDSLNQFFPMMQGFFVLKKDASNPAPYQFHDTQRVGGNGYPTSNTRAFYRQAATAVVPTFNLRVADNSNADLRDEIRVAFRSDATAGHDMRYDAVRPADNMGDNPTLFTVNANREECLRNTLPTLHGTTTIPLGLRTLVPGHSYTLRTGNVLLLGTGQVFLEDRQTGKVQDLLAEPTFTFTASAAALEHRFFLRFESVAGTVHPVAPAFEVYPNPVTAGQKAQFSAHGLTVGVATATLLTTYGATVMTKSVAVSGDGLLLGELPLTDVKPGLYILQLTSGNNVTTQRLQVR
jgi:hypothetical protein